MFPDAAARAFQYMWRYSYSLRGNILPDNRDMLRVAEKLGFHRDYAAEAGVVKAELAL